MNKKPLILVTGATGGQGGSVAKALLTGDSFAIRILTRNPNSEKALALKAAGAEIIAGDMSDVASLTAAMKDCYGVFGVTNFWEHFDKEYELGKNLIDAVHQSGISHFVLHTLANASEISHGKLPVPHFDIKAALQDYTISLGVPATFVQLPYYYENFFTFFPLRAAEGGGYTFGFPQGETRFAMVSVEDTGCVVATIFARPAEFIGRTIGIVGDDKTSSEYAAILSRVLGRHITFTHIPHAEFVALGFPGAEDLGNMFEMQRLHIPNRQAEMDESYALNPAIQDFEGWVIRNKERFEPFLV